MNGFSLLVLVLLYSVPFYLLWQADRNLRHAQRLIDKATTLAEQADKAFEETKALYATMHAWLDERRSP
jgi:hypothetical protein